jgi:hypothetical protein
MERKSHVAKKGLHVNVYKVPGKNVYRCDLKLNTSEAGEGVTIRGTSEDDGPAMMGSWLSTIRAKLSKSGQAMAKARMTLQAILSNPALASAFPQYVGPSLVALSAMEQAEKHGILPTVKKKLTDPTLKKLASETHELSTGQRQAMSGGGVCLACDGDGAARRSPPMMGDLAMPHGGWAGAPFGLPSGNPHPFAEHVRQQIIAGNKQDALFLQRMAAMTDYQRRFAKNMR